MFKDRMMDGNMIDGGGVHYVGPQSPVDMKPDATHLLTTGSYSVE